MLVVICKANLKICLKKKRELFPNSVLFASLIKDWLSVIWQCRRTEHFLFIGLIITCWSSAGFTIHVPSTWSRHHHSSRVSMTSIILKERQDKLLGFWSSLSTGTSKKKLHVQLVYVGDEFKMWKKNVFYVFVIS